MDVIQIIELVAASIGILYVILEMRVSMWLWPVGIVLPLFYIYISWVSKVYGNILVNVYYLLACIWGWWQWCKLRNKGAAEDRIRPLPSRTAYILIGVTLLIISIIYVLFSQFTDNPLPLWDAIATGVSIVGMWLLGKKYLETWYCWIASNALYSGIFLIQHYTVTGLFFVVYTIIAVLGFRQWKRLLPKGDVQ